MGDVLVGHLPLHQPNQTFYILTTKPHRHILDSWESVCEIS